MGRNGIGDRSVQLCVAMTGEEMTSIFGDIKNNAGSLCVMCSLWTKHVIYY